MRIDIRGVPLGCGVIPKLSRAAKDQNKWTDQQQRELTPQLRYGCGNRREFHNHPSKTCAIPPETIPPSKFTTCTSEIALCDLAGPMPPVSFSHKA